MLNLGIEYNLNPIDIKPQPHKAEVDRKPHAYAGGFGNLRSVPSSDAGPTVNKWQLGLYGGIIKKFTTTNAWLVGVEFSHDASIAVAGMRRGEEVSPWLFSVIGGHQFCFGRFGFSQQLGHYTYRDYESPNNFFQRYAITYLIAMRIPVGISLKAHKQEAEQMDVRIGYVF